MTVISGYKVEETTMKTRNQSRIASLLALLVGLWVVLSPIWISVSDGTLANVIIIGIVVIAASIVQYFWNSVVPSWVMGLAAVWSLISVMIYDMSIVAVWSHILSAIAVGILAYWGWAEMSQRPSDDRHHHVTPAM